MMKIVTVIGARPQIIKAAALSRAIRSHFRDQIKEVIVHTGQHYDENMSQVFFDELEIPRPDYNLKVGSGSHGKQTAAMLEGIEAVLLTEKPQAIVLYGDTNSTLAGAIAASKIGVPVVHIEAGLRSFNKSMPEEINRIACDHVSTLLFTPTLAGMNNLLNEGFVQMKEGPFTADRPGVFHCGDIMYDNSMYFSAVADEKTNIIADLGLRSGSFILATIHRNNNTDDPKRLHELFSALYELSELHRETIVLPLHPRTAKLLAQNIPSDLYTAITRSNFIRLIPPVSFLEMTSLEKNASMVFTDSGGVQKEAYFFQKPCVILRSETEWVELVESGNAVLANADKEQILRSYHHFKNQKALVFPPVFGDGHAAEFICSQLMKLAN